MARGYDRGWILLILALLGLVGAGSRRAGPSEASAATPTTASHRAAEHDPTASQAADRDDADSPDGGRELRSLAREQALLEVLRQAVPTARPSDELRDLALHESIRPIVVMVPDPTQSHMALYFDQAVAALLRAAARAKFSREPASLPWHAPTAGQAADDRALHAVSRADRQLGILLFRPPGTVHRLVAFLLVPESPVVGAPFELLADAYRLAEALQVGPVQTRQLDILGPFFSGSAEDLAQTLLDWHEQGHQDWSIRVLTGTATAFSLGELNSASRTTPLPWTFQRTVADDDSLLRFVRARLQELHVPGRGAPRIATLKETGTHYALALDAQAADPSSEQRPSARGAAESALASGESAPASEYWFPLHISQIRTAREAGGKSSDATQVQSLRRTLELKFDPREEHDADSVPVLSALTRYDTELSLSQVLNRICRDRVQYLVIAASDPADQLFVAGEARRDCPDLVLVSLGGDELMLHPDLRAVFNGALVASSYPLAFQSSAWTRAEPQEPLLQFPSPIAEGFYNASVAVIDPDPAHALDEYRVQLPGRSDCPPFGPRLWLSMAANGNFWPVATDCARSSDFYEPPVTPHPSTSAPDGRWPELRASGFAHGAGLLLLFALLLHTLAALALPARTRFGDLFVSRRGRLAAVQARYVLGAHATLLLFSGSMLAPAFYLWWHAPAVGLLRPALMIALVMGTLLCAMLLYLSSVAACAAWRTCRKRCAARWHATLVTTFTLLVVMALGAGVGARTWHWWNTWSGSEGLLAAARILDPLGACSLAPAFYLAIGFYVWSICGLRRVRQLERFSVCWPLPSKRPVPTGSDRALLDSLQGIWWRSCWHFPSAALLFFLLPSVYFWRRLLPSFEGSTYDCLIRTAFMVLYAAVVFAFLHFVVLWRRLASFLHELAAQPMVYAYDRIASKVSNSFGLQLSARVPTAADLESSGSFAQTLASLAQELALPRAPRAARLGGSAEKVAAIFRSAAQDLRRAARSIDEALAELPQNPHDPKAQRRVHDAFFAMSRSTFGVLSALWQLRAQEPDLERLPEDVEALLPGREESSEPTALLFFAALPRSAYYWLRLAEEFVALRVVTMIHHVLFQLRNLLTFALLGALSLVISMAAYPFAPSRFVTIFPWLLALTVILGSLGLILRMERNEVLSRLGRSSPGRITFNMTFLAQVFTYVVLPFAAILSRLFPETGDFIFSALSPLARLMP